jgi:hypothetical protein
MLPDRDCQPAHPCKKTSTILLQGYKTAVANVLITGLSCYSLEWRLIFVQAGKVLLSRNEDLLHIGLMEGGTDFS